MKKLLIFILFLFITTASFASSNKFNFLEKADDNYFIGGYGEHPVKFQLAIETEVYKNSGLYLGYIETALWDVNKSSAPFYDYNHSPYAEYCFKSNRNLLSVDSGLLDNISFGVRHKSNGQSSIYSRSINYVYSDAQISVGKEYKVGMYGKYLYIFNCSNKNKYYNNYTGQSEVKGFFECPYGTIYTKVGIFFGEDSQNINYLCSYKKISVPWIDAGLSFKVAKNFYTQMFINYRYGYSECMLDFNKKEQAVRLGIIL